LNRILICDDETDDLLKMKKLVSDCCDSCGLEFEIVSFSRGDECLQYLRKNPVQLALLDIYLDDISGCEVAKMLRGFDRNCAIAFVTNSREYALDGFEVGACHYLLKPVTMMQVEETFLRCGLLSKNEKKYLVVNNNHIAVKIDQYLVVYIEVYDKQSIIHLCDGRTLKTYQTLSELEQALAGGAFLRSHRSYLLNMAYVHLIDATEFILATGEKVPISQAKRKEIKEDYMDYLFSSVRNRSNGDG